MGGIILPLKILHTSDIHIGMRFNNYPDEVRGKLVEARISVLDRLIDIANKEQCDLFIIAGDLFDKISKIAKKDIVSVIKSLDQFSGECVLVMPGNHDYDNGMTELWDTFSKNITGKIVLLNENSIYNLNNYDIDGVIYPAHCDSKHSDTNNLSWIKELEDKPDVKWHIGIAHGALQGISPDIDNRYFNMSERELVDIGLDLWCLGHTHIPYPNTSIIDSSNVFNPGTPEPDGMDCKHGGNAFIIDIDDNKDIKATAVETGKYRFYDLKYIVEDERDFEKIEEELLSNSPNRKMVRLKLTGRLNKEVYDIKGDYYKKFNSNLGYFNVDDSELKIKITKEIIEKEFTKDSFPHKLLNSLADEEGAMQLAYELIKEVKK